jgi:hypothetical protein
MAVVGWRGVFWTMAGLILAAAAAIFLLLKDVACVQPARASGGSTATAPPGFRQGYGHILGDALFRRLALLGMVNQGAFIALQTLWAGPWMVTVLGMSPGQTARILFVFNLSLLLAYLGLGWWAPGHVVQDGKPGLGVTQVVRRGLLGTLLAQVGILFIQAPWAWMLWMLFALFATVTTLVQARVNLTFPEALTGRANSIYNLLLFTGAFAVQWGFGVLVDAAAAGGASPVRAMQIAFAASLALQAAALLAFVLGGKGRVSQGQR